MIDGFFLSRSRLLLTRYNKINSEDELLAFRSTLQEEHPIVQKFVKRSLKWRSGKPQE